MLLPFLPAVGEALAAAATALAPYAASAAGFATGIVIGDYCMSGNEKDSGLADLTDDEVVAGAHDNSKSGPERRRYQKEEKARGLRNKRKRQNQ